MGSCSAVIMRDAWFCEASIPFFTGRGGEGTRIVVFFFGAIPRYDIPRGTKNSVRLKDHNFYRWEEYILCRRVDEERGPTMF